MLFFCACFQASEQRWLCGHYVLFDPVYCNDDIDHILL